MIEGAFYQRHPKLDRVPLSKFEPSHLVAPLLGISEKALLERAANSQTIHGIILSDKSFVIHPSVWRAIGNHAKAHVKRVSDSQLNQKEFQKSLR
jgi:hypothetical protein